MNEINKIDGFEIKEKNDSTSLNDSAKQNEIANNFYAAKMKNITEDGIYNLVKEKNLHRNFSRLKYNFL